MRGSSKKIATIPPQPQSTEGDQKMELSGSNRKMLAMDRALYYTSLGMCWKEVCGRISKEFDYKEGSSFVEQIVKEARAKVREIQEEYATGVAQRNIARCEKIIQDALAEGNKNLAIKAMDLLNKTTNTYSNKIEIKNDDNKSFEIKIDNKE